MPHEAKSSLRRGSSPGPFFVVGCPRSGTTLLQYMLRSHSQLYFPEEESHFIVHLFRHCNGNRRFQSATEVMDVLRLAMRIRPRFFDLESFDMDAFVSAMEAERKGKCGVDLSYLINRLFMGFAHRQEKDFWGDKTPYYAIHLEVIFDLFPGARVLHVVRDGRDVALSMLRRSRDLDVYNTYHAARYWEQYVTTARERGSEAGPSRYKEVVYEQLLGDPERVMEEVCIFFGIPFEKGMVDYRRPQQNKTRTLHKTPLVGQGLRRDHVAQWRRRMTRRQIWLFEAASGDTLRAFGYPLEGDEGNLSWVVRGLFRLHNMAIAAVNRRFLTPLFKDQRLPASGGPAHRVADVGGVPPRGRVDSERHDG